MRSSALSAVASVALLVLSTSCASQTSAPPVPVAFPAPNPGTFTVDGFTAKFTEYPVGATLGDVALGPDGAVWFANFRDFFQSTIAGGQITGTGAVRLVQTPLVPETDRLMTAGGEGVGAAGGMVWMLADDPDFKRQGFVIGVSPSSAAVTQTKPLADCCAQTTQKIATDKQGNLWVLTCPDSCEAFSGIVLSFTASLGGRTSTFLGNSTEAYVPNSVGFGADGNTYVTATFVGSTSLGFLPDQGFVFKIAPNGAILAKFPLAARSDPQGIAGGPDGNLWIAERGTGSIIRMTTSGAMTHFALPNPNAAPFMIVAANDGALWFTEENGNALGRITTSGKITEYPIPTAGSQPFGLLTCPATCENAHVRLWFSERAAGKIGKFEF